MAQPFPNHPNLRGGFAPLQMECDVNDLVIEGNVPERIKRRFFYRNGPESSVLPRGTITGLLATAWYMPSTLKMVVLYRNRWVRTVKWQKERVRPVVGSSMPP